LSTAENSSKAVPKSNLRRALFR
ncbi:hypothetical protein WJX79_008748, partial [Trebouxia sp. C0005]